MVILCRTSQISQVMLSLSVTRSFSTLQRCLFFHTAASQALFLGWPTRHWQKSLQSIKMESLTFINLVMIQKLTFLLFRWTSLLCTKNSISKRCDIRHAELQFSIGFPTKEVMQLSCSSRLPYLKHNSIIQRSEWKRVRTTALLVEGNEIDINRFRSNWSLRKQFHPGLTFSRALKFTSNSYNMDPTTHWIPN